MGLLSDSLGKKKELPFGQRPSKGSFSKKKSRMKVKRVTNDSELEYLNWAKNQDLRCMVCGSGDFQLHHLKRSSSDKKNHFMVIPLCLEHHIGKEMSPHGAKKIFFEVYSWEWQVRYSKNLHKNYKETI